MLDSSILSGSQNIYFDSNQKLGLYLGSLMLSPAVSKGIVISVGGGLVSFAVDQWATRCSFPLPPNYF